MKLQEADVVGRAARPRSLLGACEMWGRLDVGESGVVVRKAGSRSLLGACEMWGPPDVREGEVVARKAGVVGCRGPVHRLSRARMG